MATKNTNTATLEKIANKIKSKAETVKEVNPADRLQAIAEKITEAPNFSWKQFVTITKISEHALRAWLVGGVSQPQKSTLESIRRYLRVSEDVLSDFMRGKITIDTLWQSRNTDIGYNLSYEEISNAIAPLSVVEKLALIGQISLMLKNQKIKEEEAIKVEEIKEEVIEEPKVEYIILNGLARKRLKAILETSLIYQKKQKEDLLDDGVDGSLIDSIYHEFEDGEEYTKEHFLTLTPHLAVPLGWMGEVPILDPASRFNQNLESLLEVLHKQ